jgi:hypothetical protein
VKGPDKRNNRRDTPLGTLGYSAGHPADRSDRLDCACAIQPLIQPFGLSTRLDPAFFATQRKGLKNIYVAKKAGSMKTLIKTRYYARRGK